MRRLAVVLLLLAGLLTTCSAAPREKDLFGDVNVRGYTRSDGTYVAPHMRSRPDGSFWNNWSTRGNVNPYTGKPGTRDYPSIGGGSYAYTLPAARPLPEETSCAACRKAHSSSCQRCEGRGLIYTEKPCGLCKGTAKLPNGQKCIFCNETGKKEEVCPCFWP